MFKALGFVSLYLMVMAMLSGCGDLKLGTGLGDKKVTSFSFDGVKLIEDGIDDGAAEGTIKQQRYNISSSSRLLTRFETLQSSKEKIIIGTDDDVWVRYTAVTADMKTLAVAHAKLCPLARGDWMMLSTWTHAHPFSKDGRWRESGGDFDSLECVTAVASIPNDPSSGTIYDAQSFYFKITRWYLDSIVGRDQNHGHTLMSNVSITIFGDGSGAYSPRILWTE